MIHLCKGLPFFSHLTCSELCTSMPLLKKNITLCIYFHNESMFDDYNEFSSAVKNLLTSKMPRG